MAAATTDPQIFENHNSNNNNNNHEVSRQEIRAAIAKAVELRALHATLMQGNSPANLRFTSSSPVSRPASHFSAQDYPVFTPSYEDEPEDGCHQIHMKNQTLSGTWDDYGIEDGNGEETALSDYKSVAGSCADHTKLQTSSGTEYFKTSRRNSLREFKSVSSGNKFRPDILTTESENVTRNSRNSNIVVPLTDSHSSVQSQPKNKNAIFSWLFPRLKKKHRNESSPSRTESEEVSQVFRDFGTVSIETLKKELIEANENRDAALMEVAEMKSSLGELKQKLEYLETYCEEMKRALRQATRAKDSHDHERLGHLLKRVKSIDGKAENQMPVNEEVMVEGFLQVVSEARLSVKQFCKTLVAQIEETDNTLMENLNLLLQPYKQSLNSKYSKVVIYHLEAIINQSLYQDFENCVFQKNGSKKLLDPQQDRQVQFSSFVALRNLSWNEVLRKGTKYYSEEFSKFCDQKMNCIVTTLNWTKPWPEQLLQAFFVAAKCIWLLHLLAFSFNPAVGILRVEENRSFDPHYMEDMFRDRQKSHGPSKVKIMMMPGFYVQDRVLRCKVLCWYKSVA